MKTILFIIFLLSGYLCLAAPLQEKGQTVKVVNIDSVYQKQMVEMSGKIQAMERELDSIGALNRDLLFSRELYSDLISTQFYWFGFFLAVVTLLFGWINFRSVFSRLKEYKKELDEYKISTNSMIENKSTILEDKFSKLITTQQVQFQEEMKKAAKSIVTAKISAFRGMFFESNRRKLYATSLRFAVLIINEMAKPENEKKISLETWIGNAENLINLITDFRTKDYEEIKNIFSEIMDNIDDKYKDEIKSLQENINIKYYSLLEKAKNEKPKN